MSRADAEGRPGAGASSAVDATGRALVRLALQEDLAGFGDVTSAWTVPAGAAARARVVAREEAVVSGLPMAAAVFAQVDATTVFTPLVAEGLLVAPGTALAEVTGPARGVLSAERVALNFLTHLCGVATQAHRFAQAVAGTGATVVDTRKTTAGLRYWEKRAVRHGGCANHRFGLFDLVLIKDNHLVAAGGVTAAVAAARAAAPFSMRIEVEVEDEAGLREALAAGADIVMLDNMPPAELRRCVAVARGLRPEVVLEASGGITVATVRAVAETGVDVVSSGALTAGAPPVDLGLDFA
jgi:nicotinate-nucleotide pyrophosphorylase (carboxylating)